MAKLWSNGCDALNERPELNVGFFVNDKSDELFLEFVKLPARLNPCQGKLWLTPVLKF